MAQNGESPSDAPNLAARANVLLPGLYAWVSTVAYPAASASAGLPPRISAGLALCALIAGALLRQDRPRLGRIFGLILFVSACVATWLLLGSMTSVERLEPVRASLGAVAWGLFAFGWGDVRKPGDVPENNPLADVREVLKARRELPRGAYAIFGLASLGGLVPVFLAWRVVRAEHALLAHAAAAACAVAMVSGGARVAVGRNAWRPAGTPGQRLNRAGFSLALVALLSLVGIAGAMSR